MKVAVIGCGVMGRHHSRIYSGLKGIKLAAVCDINLKSAKEIGNLYNANYYQSHIELLNNLQIDAASIAVPTESHLSVALDFIKRKIPVLIEKPLADSSKSAKIIIDAAKNEKVFVMTGHIERFNPAVSKLLDIVSNNALGKILSINIKRVGLFPQRIIHTNVITDLAVHDLDIATLIAKKNPDYIYAKGSGALTRGRLDNAEIFLDFKEFGCFIQVNWVTPIKVRELSITGTRGYVELDYIDQKLLLYKFNYKAGNFKEFSDFVVKFGKPDFTEVKINKQEPLKVELINFIDCVKKRAKPAMVNEDALKTICLAEKVEKSIYTRKIIKI